MMRAGALVAIAIVAAAGCGPRRVSTSAPVPPTLVVLLTEEGASAPGRAVVSSSAGMVELSAHRASTTVLAGRVPSPSTLVPEATIARAFGPVLDTLPRPPQSFTLYFRVESNELTEESRQLLPGVLGAITSHPAPEVAVVGHTDTTGDARSNYTLALERANTVRTLLTGVGVDAALIEVTSHGESDPVVPTRDDTAEPRNRRVEISVR
jgi:outer membrane protein OmpA-like peptidoglycan-associated protein